ncbi:hypothetical protein CMQ_4078 [Grosmannia clavigera kw1407]|uniref:Uncharacterized protein n=1 Tax=Grosmannia clavigera (strain kw1407 / UAMH 11150) TaxID=655863 RepID=F0X8K7_GROCL|nr:uncharacterized protein CMQ_4078 [Grosmannia clavigera kw1407]EFX06009.1 hypothetical protein CMQ_4078 [Grosmannia clavigera kw1407]
MHKMVSGRGIYGRSDGRRRGVVQSRDGTRERTKSDKPSPRDGMDPREGRRGGGSVQWLRQTSYEYEYAKREDGGQGGRQEDDRVQCQSSRPFRLLPNATARVCTSASATILGTTSRAVLSSSCVHSGLSADAC